MKCKFEKGDKAVYLDDTWEVRERTLTDRRGRSYYTVANSEDQFGLSDAVVRSDALVPTRG
jgi:hypothetical protein